MGAGLLISILGFSVCFGAVWLYRRVQSRHLREQRKYLSLFCRQVISFRQRTDIPAPIRDFVEELVRMPTDGRFIRASIIMALYNNNWNQTPKEKVYTNKLDSSVNKLSIDARVDFVNLVVTFLRAMSHSSIIFGYIFSLFRLKGLSRNTQAELAMDIVVQQQAHEPIVA